MTRIRLYLLTTALAVTGTAALAALTTQDVIHDLSAAGYTRIEVKTGPTQTKVEAIRGTEKLEQVFDTATGALLKSEVEAVRPGDDTAPGISIRDRGRDFVRGRGADDDRDDDDGDDNDDGDDDGDHDDDDDDHAGDGDDGDGGRGRGRGRGGDDGDDD